MRVFGMWPRQSKAWVAVKHSLTTLSDCVHRLLSIQYVCKSCKPAWCLAGDTALALRQSSGANSSSTAFANTSSIAAANDDYFAASTAISQGLSQLQVSLGTAAPSSLSLYLEPAFFPQAGMGRLPNPKIITVSMYITLLQLSPHSWGNSATAHKMFLFLHECNLVRAAMSYKLPAAVMTAAQYCFHTVTVFCLQSLFL